MWGPSPGTEACLLPQDHGSALAPDPPNTASSTTFHRLPRQCLNSPNSAELVLSDTYSSDHNRVLPNKAEISFPELLPTGPCSAQQTHNEHVQPFHKGNCKRIQNSHSTSCQLSSSQHMALHPLHPGPFLRKVLVCCVSQSIGNGIDSIRLHAVRNRSFMPQLGKHKCADRVRAAGS